MKLTRRRLLAGLGGLFAGAGCGNERRRIGTGPETPPGGVLPYSGSGLYPALVHRRA